MQKLVVFYSLEGTTKNIASTIVQTIGGDLLELKPKKEISSKGFMKYMWGGRQVVFKEKPELQPLSKNPNDYDLIFIGTPVWAFNYTPPLRSFFSRVKLKNKKIALFCCHEGGPRKTLENMAEALPRNEIVGKIDFWRGKEGNASKAQEWAKNLVK